MDAAIAMAAALNGTFASAVVSMLSSPNRRGLSQ
jgi:hypothetical protein